MKKTIKILTLFLTLFLITSCGSIVDTDKDWSSAFDLTQVQKFDIEYREYSEDGEIDCHMIRNGNILKMYGVEDGLSFTSYYLYDKDGVLTEYFKYELDDKYTKFSFKKNKTIEDIIDLCGLKSFKEVFSKATYDITSGTYSYTYNDGNTIEFRFSQNKLKSIKATYNENKIGFEFNIKYRNIEKIALPEFE